jgi:spoIIIJ-associated protein
MSTVLDNATAALIEEHVRRLLGVMNFGEAKVTCSAPDEESLIIEVEAGEVGSLLIGTQGTHLLAFQHIVRCLLRRQIDKPIHINVDINGYRLRRERSLLGLAEETAKKAQRTGRTVVMSPMPAADRRTIHSALANYKDVRTESLGEEPNRRVVVRPIFL